MSTCLPAACLHPASARLARARLAWATESQRWRWLLPLLLACALLALPIRAAADAAAGAVAPVSPAGPAPLGLAPGVDSAPVWPSLRLLHDPSDQLTLDQVRRRLGEFQRPQGPQGNLGPIRHPVWFHWTVQVAADAPSDWVFVLDYPSINRADLVVLSEGQAPRQMRLGALLAADERPMRSRNHSAALQLEPGQRHEFFLRVHTESSMVLPLSIDSPAHFHAREERMQLAQGLMTGVALALLVYSLAHWVALGSRLFGLYAVMLLGSMAFFLLYFGIAQQHLGLQMDGWLRKVSPQAVLLALAAGGQFVSLALGTAQHHRRLHRGLMGISLAATVALIASAMGLLDYRQSAAASTVLGTTMMLVSVPVTWQRARAGDRVGRYMLAGWTAYMVGAMSMAALLRGFLPAGLVSQHLFQWGWMVEMLAWLRVLGVHIESVRQAAEASEADRRALQALASTDPLTGLPNRRGLQQALQEGLARAGATQCLAVYLLDLDGFKPVNDRLGHEAGDQLLVQVAHRLKAALRHRDLVARLGGDEFVVLAQDLPDAEAAMVIGRQLLKAFETPFTVDAHACRVGATIGVALAPADAHEALTLLRRADAAMYLGKQAGRNRLVRGDGLVMAGTDGAAVTGGPAPAIAADRQVRPRPEPNPSPHLPSPADRLEA